MSLADYQEVLALWRRTEGIGLNESDTAPVFLFRDHARGADFWQHNGWSARDDLRVFQRMAR